MKKFLSLLLAAMMLLSCVPAMAEAFPALDKTAAWDYIGDWFGVSGLDVMGYPTTDYPELKLNLYLNGLGDLYLDGGKKEVVGWYIEDGNVFLARTVDKVPQADQIFAYAYKNETGRLVVDLAYCAVICEQEGEEYTDVTWPAFDAEDAKYFVGTWKAVTYISEGMEVPAELVGPMTIVLNDDGTAQSIEGEEEPYDLRWYSDYSVAYIGETPMELAEISFDGNGNISVKLDAETTVIMVPVAEVEETGTILGTWEDSSKTVEITEDGKLKLIYKSDGYTNHMQWEIVDGIPAVTLGTWKGAPIEFVDGKLTINPNGLNYAFTRVGDVPEIYVGPGGFEVPADDSSAAFLGNWVEDDGRGVLTFNADFTAVMNFTDGRVYDMNWKTTETGAIFTGGNWFDTAMVIENENTLNIGGGWMILYREGTEESEEMVAQPIGSEGEPYFGTWTMDMGGMAMNLILNQDGTCAMEMFGESEPGVWSVADGKANIMGDEIYLDNDGNLVHEDAGMVFVRSEGSAANEGELSEEEQMLALLALLAQMEGGEGADNLPEHLQGYVGTWYMCYMSASGLEGDMRSMGITGTFTINADGTAYMSGFSSDEGQWYEEDGTVRFGEYGVLLQLLDGGFLQYGTELSGMMIFSQDENAVYVPAGAAPVVPAVPEAPVVPAASGSSATFGSYEDYMDIKFVATTYTSFGTTMDASMLGAEYSVTFHANGTCEFVMAGINTPGLTWGLQEVAMGLNKTDAFVINYYGVMYNCIPTGTGFDMDFYGTMNLHFVPAQ